MNFYFDDFGLFRSHKSRRIWGLEKTSKYLMSFKYIPENFNAVLVGSSVSANMDPSGISAFKVYNLSMNSGNISELKYPLMNLIESDSLKAVIFCLYDYTTKNSGVKGKQINEKEYWGSLYSIFPFEILKWKIKYYREPNRDIFHMSSNGYNDFNRTKKNLDFLKIKEKYLNNPRTELLIDSTAFKELSEIVEILHEKQIKIFGYFYPIYNEWFDIFKKNGQWESYKNKIESIFNMSRDHIWDLNSKDFDYINDDLKVYSDGHLSSYGSERLIQLLDSLIMNPNGTKPE